jgi:hypothetical protein
LRDVTTQEGHRIMGRSRTNRAQTSTEIPDEQLGRRALLRRAATVAAAGIGGVAATEMLTAGPASAAAGDPMVLGVNDAVTAQTKLSSAAAAGATLEITHAANIANLRLPPVDTALDYTGTKTVVGHGDNGRKMKGGELLNLTESVTTDSGTSNVDTLFWMAGPNTSGTSLANLAVVLTTATGTVFAPYGPKRVLDTRVASGRTLIANAASVLDSQGRLIAGKSLQLDLDTFVRFAYALHYNLMATQAVGDGGAVAVWGPGSRPSATQVHFDKTKPVANCGIVPLSENLSVFLYTSVTCHVVLDVQGWTLPDFSFLISSSDPASQHFAAARAIGQNASVVRRATPSSAARQ